MLTEHNQRLYRQSRNYRVQVSLVGGPDDDGLPAAYNIFTLPNTWFTHGAIRYAFKNYKAAMKDELAQTGGKTAKWHDFRIALNDPDGVDAAHESVVWDGNTWVDGPTPGDGTPTSSITNAAGTSMGFHVVGDVTNSYNIFQQYALWLNSRRTPAVDFAGPQAYEDLQEDAVDLDKLMESGDQPPYSIDNLAMWDSDEDGTLTDSSAGLAYQDTLLRGCSGTDLTEGRTQPGQGIIYKSRVFDAPLGILYISTSRTDYNYTHGEGGPELAVTVSPGKYKGVHSEDIANYRM